MFSINKEEETDELIDDKEPAKKKKESIKT
jgi:hypothetical protein